MWAPDLGPSSLAWPLPGNCTLTYFFESTWTVSLQPALKTLSLWGHREPTCHYIFFSSFSPSLPKLVLIRVFVLSDSLTPDLLISTRLRSNSTTFSPLFLIRFHSTHLTFAVFGYFLSYSVLSQANSVHACLLSHRSNLSTTSSWLFFFFLFSFTFTFSLSFFFLLDLLPCSPWVAPLSKSFRALTFTYTNWNLCPLTPHAHTSNCGCVFLVGFCSHPVRYVFDLSRWTGHSEVVVFV